MKRVKKGLVLGGVRLERKIGTGASAVVFWGREVGGRHEKRAVKVLRSDQKEKWGKAFAHEVKTFKESNNPAFMATYYRDGEEDGIRYCVMELLTVPKDKFRGARFLAFALSFLDAVETCHSMSLFHGDIKPGNLALRGKQVVLIDFGCSCTVAERTTREIKAGSERYVAPEVLRGGAISVKSDIFSSAITLVDFCHDDDLPLYEPILSRAASPDPSRRPETVAEFREAIRLAAPTFKSRAEKATRLPKFKSVTMWSALAVAGILAVLAALFAIHWYDDFQKRQVRLNQENEYRLDVNAQIRRGLLCYQSGNIPLALDLLESGTRSEWYNPEDFKDVNVNGILEDCRRRLSTGFY